MERIATYRVEGMSCAHCEAAIREELAEVSGVEDVDVDLGGKLVRVHGAAHPDAVRAAIVEAGYEPAPA